jgi:hypothetical protein
LSAAGRLTHRCTPWLRPPLRTKASVGTSSWRMPDRDCHPLGGAGADESATAVRVVVFDDTLEHVGDGLEATVGVPRRPTAALGAYSKGPS